MTVIVFWGLASEHQCWRRLKVTLKVKFRWLVRQSPSTMVTCLRSCSRGPQSLHANGMICLLHFLVYRLTYKHNICFWWNSKLVGGFICLSSEDFWHLFTHLILCLAILVSNIWSILNSVAISVFSALGKFDIFYYNIFTNHNKILCDLETLHFDFLLTSCNTAFHWVL